MEGKDEKAYLQEWLAAMHTPNMAGLDLNKIDGLDRDSDDNYPHGFSQNHHLGAYGADSDSDLEDGGYVESSSSSSEDGDGHDDLMDSQTYQALRRKKKMEQSKETEKEKPRPKWFQDQSFQYHGRVLLLAAPGLFMVLALGGDMLLTVVTVGALAVHLFHVAGDENKTFIAFLVAFICTELTVLYSAIPLLWKSMLNALLIIWLNMYCVLTGSWLMLVFRKFRQREPELAKFIESSLFSLYPAVCAALVAWVVAVVTSVSIAPYCLLLVGFGLLQVFLTPTASSFIKPGAVTPEAAYILDPDLVAALALFYSVSPTCVHLVTNIVRDWWALTDTAVLVEGGFLACLSVFLTTYLSWRPFMDKSGLPFVYVQRSRWAAGLGALLLLGVVLHCWGVQSPLVSWLPLVLGLQALLTVLFIQKYSNTYILLTLAGVVVVYIIILLQLPWLIDYYVYGFLHLNVIYVLLLVNGVLCLGCVYGATHFTPDLFGFLFLLQSVCTVTVEKCLLAGDILPYSYVVLLAVFLLYIILRLSKGVKLPWQHALLSMSLHLASVLTSADHLVATVTPTTLWRGSIDLLATWGWSACVMQALWFETRPSLTQKQVVMYMLTTAGTGLLSTGCLSRLLTPLMARTPEVEVAAVVLCVTGGVGLKVTSCHQCQLIYGKHVSVATMALAFLVLCVQPTLTLAWEDVVMWLATASLLLGIGLISIVMRHRVTIATILLPGMLIGLPLALGFSFLVYQTVVPPGVYLSLCAVFMLCISLGLAVWLQPGDKDRNVKLLLVTLTLVCATAVTFDLVEPPDSLTPLPGVMAACVGSLGGAVILKLHSLWNQGGHLTSQGELYISRLPLWGNLATCASFIFLVIICPVSERLAWVCLCSEVWFLLQKDNVLIHRRSKDSHWAPTALTVAWSLLAMTLYHSDFWTAKTNWASFLGFVEVAMTTLSLPTYVILTSVLWSGVVLLSDRLVVFLLPVNWVLPLVASTYTCWLHAACTLLASLWMMKYRLPLTVR